MRPAKCRSAAGVAVSRFVDALDQITRVLEFDRQEESRRDVDALQLDARLFEPQEVISFVQKAKPLASDWRLRKSW